VLEAMASGLPVVCTETAGVSSFATRSLDCLMAPPGDAPELAHAVLSVLEDGALAARLSAAARQTALAFSPERAVQELERVLYSLAACRQELAALRLQALPDARMAAAAAVKACAGVAAAQQAQLRARREQDRQRQEEAAAGEGERRRSQQSARGEGGAADAQQPAPRRSSYQQRRSLQQQEQRRREQQQAEQQQQQQQAEQQQQDGVQQPAQQQQDEQQGHADHGQRVEQRRQAGQRCRAGEQRAEKRPQGAEQQQSEEQQQGTEGRVHDEQHAEVQEPQQRPREHIRAADCAADSEQPPVNGAVRAEVEQKAACTQPLLSVQHAQRSNGHALAGLAPQLSSATSQTSLTASEPLARCAGVGLSSSAGCDPASARREPRILLADHTDAMRGLLYSNPSAPQLHY
jgi:hypothetical protein